MAKGYIFDKLMNRKIEGDSSFVSQESFDESIGDLQEAVGDVQHELETVENFNLVLSTSLPEGVTESDTSYKKCVYIHSSKILWLIVETRITNTTESTVSLPNIGFDVTVTDAIGAKVMKIDGISIKDYVSSSGQSNIITKACGVNGSYGGSAAVFTVGCYAKNVIHIYCSMGNISAGSTHQVEIRVPLLIV